MLVNCREFEAFGAITRLRAIVTVSVSLTCFRPTESIRIVVPRTIGELLRNALRLCLPFADSLPSIVTFFAPDSALNITRAIDMARLRLMVSLFLQ